MTTKSTDGWMDILGCYPYIIKLFKYYRLFLKRCQLALFRILLLLLVISSLVGYRHGNYIFIDGLEHEPTSCSASQSLIFYDGTMSKALLFLLYPCSRMFKVCYLSFQRFYTPFLYTLLT